MKTNEPLDMHRPAADFRDYLEGEVIREYRRRRTFRRLRTAAVIIVSAGIGMSATLASAQVRGNAQRDSLQEAIEAKAMLASIRFNLAKAQLTEEQQQVSIGMRPKASLAAAELQLRIAEEEVARVILDGREVQASGLPPRDELNAPLVKGEDFVKQRIQNRLMTAERRMRVAQDAVTEVGRRVTAGAATELERSDAETALFSARADLAILAARLQARDEFIAKGTAVEDLLRRVERAEVQQAMIVAQHGLETAQMRLDLVEKRRQAGAATEVDVLRARLEMSERRLDLQKAAERLKRLK